MVKYVHQTVTVHWKCSAKRVAEKGVNSNIKLSNTEIIYE